MGIMIIVFISKDCLECELVQGKFLEQHLLSGQGAALAVHRQFGRAQQLEMSAQNPAPGWALLSWMSPLPLGEVPTPRRGRW